MTRIFSQIHNRTVFDVLRGIGNVKLSSFFRNEIINKNEWRGKCKVNYVFNFFLSFFVLFFLFILELFFLGCHSRSQQWDKIWKHISRNVNEWIVGSTKADLLELWHWNQDNYYWLLTFGSVCTLALKIHIPFISLIICKSEKDRFYISSGKLQDSLY